MVAQARANRFKLQHSIEDVNNQIASLAGHVSPRCKPAKARLARAKADYQIGRWKCKKRPGPSVSKMSICARRRFAWPKRR